MVIKNIKISHNGYENIKINIVTIYTLCFPINIEFVGYLEFNLHYIFTKK